MVEAFALKIALLLVDVVFVAIGATYVLGSGLDTTGGGGGVDVLLLLSSCLSNFFAQDIFIFGLSKGLVKVDCNAFVASSLFANCTSAFCCPNLT